MSIRNFVLLILVPLSLIACGGGSSTSGALLPIADQPADPVTPTPTPSPTPAPAPTPTPVITPVNQAPIVRNDSASIQEDGLIGGLDVLANDSDPDGDPLQITGVSADPAVGSVSVTTLNRVRYEPASNLNGVVTIEVMVSDGQNQVSSTLEVVIQPVDDEVILRDDYLSVVEGSSENSLSVLANDEDLSQGGIDLIDAEAASGAVEVVGSDIVYTPLPDFVGSDIVTYQIVDVDGDILEAVATIEVEALAGETLNLEWQNPERRRDGAILQLSDIDAYVIELRNVETNELNQIEVSSTDTTTEGRMVEYALTGLRSGFFELSLKVVDGLGNIGESFTTEVVRVGG